jgi:hypothetical protein
MHHTVVVNARAGTVLEAGAEAFAARICAAFAAHDCSARSSSCIRANSTTRWPWRSRRAELHPRDRRRRRHDQWRAADPAQAGRPVGILPLGTVNVLGRDLGLYGTLEHQIEALCNGEPVTMDIGRSTTGCSIPSPAWASSA